MLIEFGFKEYDAMILVTIDRDMQIKRLLKKGKYNKKEIENIIDSQMSQEKKAKYADFIIDNSGKKSEFKKNLIKIIKSIEAR